MNDSVTHASGEPHATASEIEAEHARLFTPDRSSRVAEGVWIALGLVAALAVGVLLSKPILGLFHKPQPTAQREQPVAPLPNAPRQTREVVTGQQACAGKKVLWYQAPMNAAYHSPKPGKSPMGMDLVPACYGEQVVAAGGVPIDPRVRQDMGVVTAPVKMGELVKTIRTVGYVDYDERRLSVMNTKISGWVDKLYVNFTGQKVFRGQPLLAIYSPDLVSSEQDLLIAAKQYQQNPSDQNKLLMNAAEQRFAYWDVPESVVQRIERTGKIERAIVLSAPATGVVVEKKTLEGAHVNAGDELFKIADLSRVWVYVHVYEMDVPFVKVGQRVTIRSPYDPGQTLEGKVDYIFPWVGDKSRDVRARLAFKNPNGALKPGMYVNADIHADLRKQALLVSDSAVIRTGTRSVVFVAGNDGTFAPRTIQLGVELDNSVQVSSGLKAGERVVTDGQFMLDSESRLKDAAQKFEKPATIERHEQVSPSTSPAPMKMQGEKAGAMHMAPSKGAKR
jgi:RND family efflux transporter MFP subunit